jgi:predicted Zn-dependent protease
VAGRMEADQLPQARSILDSALRISLDRRCLGVLDGVLAYREGRLRASAAIFDSLARRDPTDRVTQQNQARVRAELTPADQSGPTPAGRPALAQ